MVEFYRSNTLIGLDNGVPFAINWTNLPLGNYSLTAKATDNDGNTTISSTVNITVAPKACKGTAPNGDYSYRAETVGRNVVFIFHPLQPILGSGNAIIYVREGPSGGYPGYNMTAVGQDFRFTKAIAGGTNLSIYFTYGVSTGGERNSAATPHAYTVGTNCATGGLPIKLLQFSATAQPNGNVALNWSIASEVNNKFFTIEKSRNGTDFTWHSNIASKGNSQQVQHYATWDAQPAEGLNYYRLKQTDIDGTTSFHGTRQVLVKLSTSNLSVYPNPINTNLLTINLPAVPTNKTLIQLRGIDDRLVFSNWVSPVAQTIKLRRHKCQPQVFMHFR